MLNNQWPSSRGWPFFLSPASIETNGVIFAVIYCNSLSMTPFIHIKCFRYFPCMAFLSLVIIVTSCQKPEYEHSYVISASVDCYTNRGGGVWSVKKFGQKQFVLDSNSQILETTCLEKVFSKVAGKNTIYTGGGFYDNGDLSKDWVDYPYNKFDFAYLHMSYSDTKRAMSSGSKTYFVLPDKQGVSFFTDCPRNLFDKKPLQNIIDTAIPE